MFCSGLPTSLFSLRHWPSKSTNYAFKNHKVNLSMIVLLSGPIDTYDITSLFSFESIRAETSLVNSFLYMQNKVFLYTEAISLWIWSSSVPSRKGGNTVEELGEKQKKPRERKHPNAMLPTLFCLLEEKIPIRNNTYTTTIASSAFPVGMKGTFPTTGQDLKLATFSTI